MATPHPHSTGRPRHSSAHSVAARLVSAAIAVTGLASVPLDTWEALVGVALVVPLALWFHRPPLGRMARRSALALPMIAGLLVPLALGGDVLRAGALGARALCSLVTVLAFTISIHPVELPAALTALHFPQPLVLILSSMTRQLSAIGSQAQRISLSRKLRGATGAGISAEALAGLLASTARRADRVELAMRLRGSGSHRAEKDLVSSRDIPLLLFGCALALLPQIIRFALQRQ